METLNVMDYFKTYLVCYEYLKDVLVSVTETSVFEIISLCLLDSKSIKIYFDKQPGNITIE